MQIDIDFDVFKALTALREHEGHSYNDVLRKLLNLDSIQEPGETENSISKLFDQVRPAGTFGFYSRGLILPDGTLLRARYKQHEYQAKIVGEKWVDKLDREHLSPSAAAAAITGTNVNGLRFWEAKRPNDPNWRRLELLRSQ